MLHLGLRERDIPYLSMRELISIAAACHPGTAIYHSITGGYGTAEHLLATSLEYQAGLVSLPQRIAREGVTDLRPMRLPDIRDPKTKKLTFDLMTIEDYEAHVARLKEPD